MNGTWINRVRHVNDGEAVNGAIDSRPTRALEGNTQYLKARIDSAELGEAVCAYGETIQDDVLVGMAVYRNSATARYERALAAVEMDANTGVLVPSASSDTVGIVVFKWNATKADILLAGRRLVDISEAVDGTVMPGRYYLSSAVPGMLVQQRPPVSVSVLVYTDDGMAIVQPTQRDFLEDHIHYKVRLYSQPAGKNVVTSVGGDMRHVVQNPDPALHGWLPADHISFNFKAPTGAAFGYNLAAHPELARIFPPIPPTSAVVYLDRGDTYAGVALVPMGPGGLCIVDKFGIWWMSNCPGDAPWPEDWTASIPPPLTGADPPWLTVGASPPECPRSVEFQIILSYTMMVFTTERTSVTSLRPADGSPLVFTNCDDQDATTGDLCADLDLSFLSADNADDGSMVFKEMEGAVFQRGRVIEGLIAGSNCTLDSDFQKDTTYGTVHQGLVTVSLTTGPSERELPADLIRLAQTQERFHLEIPYIGFDAGRDTSFQMRFYVPTDGLPYDAVVMLRMQLLGRSSGTLPNLLVTYQILPRPVPAPPPAAPGPPVPKALPLPVTATALPIVTGMPITADYYTEVQSDLRSPITVSGGETILVTLTRSRSDSYTGEVGVMRPVGILTTRPGV